MLFVHYHNKKRKMKEKSGKFKDRNIDKLHMINRSGEWQKRELHTYSMSGKKSRHFIQIRHDDESKASNY